MEPKSLSQFYDDIKAGTGRDELSVAPGSQTVDMSKPNARDQWNNIIQKKANELKDKCRARLIVDIYTKILPLDDEFKARNGGILDKDVQSMLTGKGYTPTQYFTTAYESTKAPLLEFVLRATDNIAKAYIEEAEETFKKAEEDKVDPVVPNTDDVEDQVVEVQKDAEYSNFIDALKQKTVNKIVDDISELINDRKEKEAISFEPKQESSQVAICMDHLQKQFMESTNIDRDELIGLSIRESTLNQMDYVFKFPNGEIKLFESAIRYGKGYVINEAAKKDSSPSSSPKGLVDKIVKEFIKLSGVNAIGFEFKKIKQENDDVFMSKIGGVPYLPKDHPYVNKKAVMIIQINLGDIPKTGLLPKKGILQVWMDVSKSHKISVVYHSTITRSKSNIISDMKYTTTSPDIMNDKTFPIYGVYKLNVKSSGIQCGYLGSEPNKDRNLNQAISTVSNAEYKVYGDLPKEVSSNIYNKLKKEYSKIGGVLQLLGNKNAVSENNKQLLFKLDRFASVTEDDWRFPEGQEILQIFIDKNKLNNLDFSHISYDIKQV